MAKETIKINEALFEKRNENIAVLGVGNLGSNMVERIVNSGLRQSSQIILSNRSKDKTDHYLETGYVIADSNIEATLYASTILVAVKPYQMFDVLKEIGPYIKKYDLIISVAAGFKIDRMTEAVGKLGKKVRAMPNLAGKFGLGVTGWFCGDELSNNQKALIESIFGCMGIIVRTRTEDGINRITAASGSAIGFQFKLQEVMEDITENILEGEVDPDVAKKIATQNLKGSQFMLENDGRRAGELCRAVTSEKGTTEAGLRAFERLGLRTTLATGFYAAYQRSKEIGDTL